MSLDLTVICCTLGDTAGVIALLASLERSIDFSEKVRLQFIVVDQSSDARVECVGGLARRVEFTYLHSKKLGLSRNRNLALKSAKYGLITILDSDCVVPSSFCSVVKGLDFTDCSAIIGKVKSIEAGADILKSWPPLTLVVSLWMRWRLACSINVIFRKDIEIYYDERFGIGATFGSCEDVDFILRCPGLIKFEPHLYVLHPDQSFSSLSYDKAYKYGEGFGAVCAKHWTKFGIVVFILGTTKRFGDFLLCRGRTNLVSVAGRLMGFLRFVFRS